MIYRQELNNRKSDNKKYSYKEPYKISLRLPLGPLFLYYS